MPSVFQALVRGFRSAKEDRIAEWPSIRQSGFIRSWIKRDLPVVALLGFFHAVIQIGSSNTSSSIQAKILEGLGIAITLLIVIGLLEFAVWNGREREWRKAQLRADAGEG